MDKLNFRMYVQHFGHSKIFLNFHHAVDRIKCTHDVTECAPYIFVVDEVIVCREQEQEYREVALVIVPLVAFLSPSRLRIGFLAVNTIVHSPQTNDHVLC